MKRVLIDVDTQFDFMHPNGSLYVPAKESVSDAIRHLLEQGNYDAVVGSVDSHAYDAWEFAENGGPFPAHCVKGTSGWLRMFPSSRERFIPMTWHNTKHPIDFESIVMVGESVEGEGNRKLNPYDLADEAINKGVALYFEKEVYSLFSNPFAAPTLRAVCEALKFEDWSDVQIDVMGYCAGGYCVDAAVKGLFSMGGFRKANIRVLAYATAAIGGDEGMEKSRRELTGLGAKWVEEAE